MLENKKDGWKAFISLLPAFLFLIVFTFIPIIYAFLMSFMKGFDYAEGGFYNIFANSYEAFPSIAGYVEVLQDGTFIRAIENTAIMVLISVPLTIAISLLMAVALNGIKKLQGLYQTIFFLPYVTNAIALGMVFNVMFSKADAGLINQLLHLFNLSSRDWIGLEASRGAMLTVITIYTVWNGLAFKVLVFLSGLQSIDKQYYDAARMDGTNKATIFRRITVPLLSPQILYITITSFIGAFKAYTSVISVFGAGPTNFGGSHGESWITIVGYIYKKLKSGEVGAYTLASAGSMILLVIILLITVLQFAVSKKRVHY